MAGGSVLCPRTLNSNDPARQGGISHSKQTLDGSGLSTLSGWVSQSWKSGYMSPGVTWRETGCQKKVALPNSLSTLGSRFEA